MIAKKFPTHARQKGFTLTEIAIVLGIMGLILGAIWTAASSVYQNQRASHAQTAILQIAQGVRNLYAQSSSTGTAATDLTASLITAGVIPTDLVRDTTSAINPWAGGTTKVWTPGTGDSFTVEMTGVPQAACISILSTVAGVSRDQSLFAVAAGAAAAPVTAAGSGALNTLTGQVSIVTPAIAATACTSAPNTIQFGFSLKS